MSWQEKFTEFCSQLRIDSKEEGIVPLRLNGCQQYFIEEIAEGLERGIRHFVILKGRQLGICLDPSTRVLTADLRWVRIDELKTSNEIISVDEEPVERAGRNAAARRMRVGTVLAVVEVFHKAYRLSMDDGRTLICTGKHPWLATKRKRAKGNVSWRSIDGIHKSKLQVGSWIRWITKPWSEPTADDGWFGGMLDGEGCISRPHENGASVSVSQKNGPVWDRLLAYAQVRGYHPHYRRDEYPRSGKFGKEPVPALEFARMDEIIRLIGQTRPVRFIGRRFWEGKHLPGKRNGDAGWAQIVKIEELPPQKLIDLQTTVGTYIAEGFVSHNTTVSIALDIFWAFENAGLQGGLLFDNDSNKEKFRDTISRYIQHLPRGMKLPILAHNRYQLVMKNRSDFQYMVAGTRTSNDTLGRAKALNFLHSTECGFYADQEGLDTLSSSLAEKNPKRLYIFESTANGYNSWYDMWQTAKIAIRQKPIFIGWWRKEAYCFDPGDKEYQVYWGSAAQLSGNERLWVQKIKRYYDFEVKPGQIAWYRWHLAEQKKDDILKMTQEYPATEDEAFVVAGSKFFTGERLTSTYIHAKRTRYDSWRYVTGSEVQFTQLYKTSPQNAELKVWEEPKADGIYVIGADPAYGSSDTADRFAIEILRCYADRLIQVAEYCNDDITTAQFAWIIAHLGGAYRNVWLNLEMTGPGFAVQNELVHLQRTASQIPVGEHRTLQDVLPAIKHYFWTRPDAMVGGGVMKNTGTMMTEYLKRSVMNSLRDSFEVGRLEVRSTSLLDEMRSVVNDEGKISASGRGKDDRVMATALANWIWIQNIKSYLVAERRTYAIEQARTQAGPTPAGQMQRQVMNYLRAAGITLK